MTGEITWQKAVDVILMSAGAYIGAEGAKDVVSAWSTKSVTRAGKVVALGNPYPMALESLNATLHTRGYPLRMDTLKALQEDKSITQEEYRAGMVEILNDRGAKP